jgi:hypothetical protein
LVLTNLFWPQQLRRFAEVAGEVSNAGDVSFDGVRGSITYFQIIDQVFDEEWSCESSFHGQNVRLVTNIMLCRKELSLALKSIRDVPLLSRAYRVAVLFNARLSDDRRWLQRESIESSIASSE